MIHHQRSLMIDATPEAIWSVLGRFMHIDEFAPLVSKVDALTSGDANVGAKRRCHFEDGGSVVEEVTNWVPNRGYRVLLSETDPMPITQAHAELRIHPKAGGNAEVVWSMDYQMKFGPLGWLLGQTVMKRMMGKVLDGNLQGLAAQVQRSTQAA